MTLIEELAVFAKNILHCVYAFAAFSLFFFSCGLTTVTVSGREYSVPFPMERSFSVEMFTRMKADLLPPGVQLVVTDPMNAFVSQIVLSLFLGAFATFPFFLHRFILYVRPALFPRERMMLLLCIFPSAALFFSGAVFAYLFLVPATFKVLYPYAIVLGVIPFFTVNEFIYYVFSMAAVTGVMFLLPIFMALASFTGIVSSDFWADAWRYAVVLFLLLSAAVTPDGTGVTMILLFLPLAALYGLGYLLARHFSKRYIFD